MHVLGSRLGPFVLAFSVVAATTAAAAHSALFFLFSPTSAHPGDKVVVRTGGTPAGFRLRDQVEGRQQPIRLYLIPNAIADDVTSRDDSRLTPIGTLVPDKNGHGILTFRVPAVKGGSYAAAAWCPGCAAYSFGDTFFTLRVSDGIVPRFRPLMLLRVMTGGSRSGWPFAVGWAAAIFLVVIGAAIVLGRRLLVQRRALMRGPLSSDT
jgi:hypothetical protein